MFPIDTGIDAVEGDLGLSENFITDEVKALIGAETEVVEAYHPVEASEVRRFHHATLDPAKRYWDSEWAANSRYGAVVAPPAFAVHAFRRAPSEADPLEVPEDAKFDGHSRSFNGLPEVNVPLERLVNGGYQYEFFRYPKIGERIFRKSRYKDIYQRDGRSGPMVFVIFEDEYFVGSGEILLNVQTTAILR